MTGLARPRDGGTTTVSYAALDTAKPIIRQNGDAPARQSRCSEALSTPRIESLPRQPRSPDPSVGNAREESGYPFAQNPIHPALTRTPSVRNVAILILQLIGKALTCLPYALSHA